MSTPALALPPSAAPTRLAPHVHWHDRLAQGLLLLCCIGLALFLLAPLAAILVKSVQDKYGAFVGLLQFREYFATPALQQLDLEHAVGGNHRDLHHGSARVHLCLWAHPVVHARQDRLPRASR